RRRTSDRSELWNQLVLVIDRVNIQRSQPETHATSFNNTYKRSSNITKDHILTLLNQIKVIALLMRGWDGVSNILPLESAYNSDYFGTIDRVCTSIAKFNEYKIKHNEAGRIVSNLSLIYHKNGQFSISDDIKRGLTIQNRLDIVVSRDGDNINSCIRLSSNCLLASVHLYMNAIGINPGFKISSVAHIS